MTRSFKLLAKLGTLLAPLVLATSSHSAIVTQNFNWTSPELTLKTTVTFDDTVNNAPTSSGLTVNEFTTTLIGFTLPTLLYGWSEPRSTMTIYGGPSPAWESDIDDVIFASPGFIGVPIRASAGYGFANASSFIFVSTLTFDQSPFSPPAPPLPSGNDVPEPTSLALVGIAAVAGISASRRRRQR
jgi:hypothetical protein